ncbi:LysR family transcriptional regulator [Marinicrinis lubricantis]|uniref:LysR family transcriptional regulator n=1 Tax=Marinicrinis lubricantis TaxID=2086470 RepID=A0ABW1IM97_9BACL
MDLKAIQTFQTIVNFGSFHRAAEEMNYAQSTVTMQIQKLESELGVALFARGRKQIRLTEAGRLFYEQSLHITRQVEHLQTSLSDFMSGEGGEVRMGVTEPAASHRFPAILAEFLSQFPKIRISLDISNTPILSERLLKGNLDIAICSPAEMNTELYFEPLFVEEFMLLMPKDHPLAIKDMIEPKDFQGYRLLITSPTCPYRRKLEMILQESGMTSIDTMEIGSMTALKHYVASGFGMALVPKIMLNPAPEGTTIRAMSGSQVNMSIGILMKSSENPLNLAGIKLVKYLKQWEWK